MIDRVKKMELIVHHILSHSQPTLKTREILTPYELEQVPTVFAPPATQLAPT